jgi:hypothetical protein
VFSDTVGGSLKEALRRVGRRDRVIHLSDNLSFGPINPPDPAARQDWIRAQFLIDLGGREWPAGAIDKFWHAALSTSARRIVWVSKRAAHEYAGFLELLWRLGDATCTVVEFDQDEIAYRRPDGNTRSSVAISLANWLPNISRTSVIGIALYSSMPQRETTIARTGRSCAARTRRSA